MRSISLFRTFILLVLMVCVVAAAQAATYGYIVVRGKNADMISRELDTIERLINTWKNGEVLYRHTVVSGGAFFFKKVTSTVFFAGDQRSISAFLTSGPYEGDYLREVVVQLNYRTFKSKNSFDGDINTAFTRKYANIRKAIETIQGKNSATLWEELKAAKGKDYKKHLVGDQLINPIVSVGFYSVQAVEENRLFGITFTGENTIPEK
jgi:hypothetical protein